MKGTLYRTGVDEPGEPVDDVHWEGTEDDYVNLYMGRYYLELSSVELMRLYDDLAELVKS